MSYTPTNWQDGDIVTAEKLNNIESGISMLDSYPLDGKIVFIEVEFDYETGQFSTEMNTNDALGYFYGGNVVFARIMDIPLRLFPYIQEGIARIGWATMPVPLDSLGLTGEVGYLTFNTGSESSAYTITLFHWTASAGLV